MHITTPLANELANYLDLSALELKVTAQNMANVDTPGYRTVGFNFAEAMQQSVEQMEQRKLAQESQIAATDGFGGAFAAMDAADNTATPPAASDPVAFHQVGGLLERPDGNDVSVDREGLNMAKAQLQFNVGLTLLKQQYAIVMDAINVDK